MTRLTIAGLALSAFAVTAAAQGGGGRTPPPPPPTPPVRPVPPSAPVVVAPSARVLTPDGQLLRLDELRGALTIDRDRLEELARLSADQAVTAARDALILSRDALEQAALESRGLTLAAPLAPGRIQVQPRYQNDPADSLYRRAMDLLNRFDYRAAATRFSEVPQRYPNSQYVARAMYFQSFALYRAGADAELRQALNLLEQLQQRFPNARFTGENNHPADAAALAQRIRGTLANRGDAAARAQVSQTAARTTLACDREEQDVRQEALRALNRVDAEAARPKLEQILATREECAQSMRRFALQVLTQRGDDRSIATLISTARQDPDPQMRSDAIGFVARHPSDAVLDLLESAVRNEQSESVRRTAARSLVGYPSPRARQAVRALVEDNSASDNLRREVLSRYDAERGTPDDATWMRAAYPRVTSPSVKSALVDAIGRIGGADGRRWLMDLANNDAESASIRSTAFRSVSRTMTVAELSRAYDAAGSRPMRESIVQALNSRKEPEALDKMIDIVKQSSDPTLRRTVIQMLAGKNDPKATAALLELIDR